MTCLLYLRSQPRWPIWEELTVGTAKPRTVKQGKDKLLHMSSLLLPCSTCLGLAAATSQAVQCLAFIPCTSSSSSLHSVESDRLFSILKTPDRFFHLLLHVHTKDSHAGMLLTSKEGTDDSCPQQVQL